MFLACQWLRSCKVPYLAAAVGELLQVPPKMVLSQAVLKNSSTIFSSARSIPSGAQMAPTMTNGDLLPGSYSMYNAVSQLH